MHQTISLSLSLSLNTKINQILKFYFIFFTMYRRTFVKVKLILSVFFSLKNEQLIFICFS